MSLSNSDQEMTPQEVEEWVERGLQLENEIEQHRPEVIGEWIAKNADELAQKQISAPSYDEYYPNPDDRSCVTGDEQEDPDPDDWETDYPFPRTRITREMCGDDLEEAYHEARGEFDDEPIDEYSTDREEDGLEPINDPQLDAQLRLTPTQIREVIDPLTLAHLAKAIVEWSGRELPLDEWLEVF